MISLSQNELKTIGYYGLCNISNNIKYIHNLNVANCGIAKLSKPKKKVNKYIAKITNRIILDLSNLEYLNFSDNIIKKIPKQIGMLNNLQTLACSNNHIEQFPKEIEKLVKLKVLDCHNNNIKDLIHVSCLISLQKLICGHNIISILPPEIGKLINLQRLYCYGNQLKKIPSEIGNLVNLQILNCTNNQIDELPREIEKLVNLQELYCTKNKIKKLPLEITKLVNLQEIYCNENLIEELPPDINNLINLILLDCSDNLITKLPYGLGNFTNIRYFNYFGNTINHIPPNVIRLIHRLENINHNTQNIYGDTQSVHNHNIQTGIKNSIKNILNHKPCVEDYIEYILRDEILDIYTKESLIEYSKDENIHTELNITFGELLKYVISRIESNPHKDEIKKILNEEMRGALCKCTTGRISRLINSLNGFDKEIIITISDSEQISQIVILIKGLFGYNVKQLLIKYI